MTRSSKQSLLLMKDVDNLGRKGEIVTGASPGFIRNFLLPQGYAVIADKRAVRLQEQLKQERAKQAEVDRQEATVMATKLKDATFVHTVKVDPFGHLYGSVTPQDIVDILAQQGLTIDRKMVLLGAPIRSLGIHRVPLRLKEGVQAAFNLRVQDESGQIEIKQPKEASPAKEPLVETPTDSEDA